MWIYSKRFTTASLTLPFSACAAIRHKPAVPSSSLGATFIIKLIFPSLLAMLGLAAAVGGLGPMKALSVIAELPVSPVAYVYEPLVSI